MNKEKIDILIRMLQTHVNKEVKEDKPKTVKSIQISPFDETEINKIKGMIFEEIDKE